MENETHYSCQPTTPDWDSWTLGFRFAQILFGTPSAWVKYVLYKKVTTVWVESDKGKVLAVIPKEPGPNGRPEWAVTANYTLSAGACAYLSEAVGPFVALH